MPIPFKALDPWPPRHGLLIWLVRLRWAVGVGAVFASLVPATTPGLPWGDRWVVLLGVGLTILAHNALLAASLRTAMQPGRVLIEPASMILVGVGVDLIGLSILAALTGGTHSPLITYYAAHVVLAATVFGPGLAVVVAIAAIAVLGGMLAILGAAPDTLAQALALGGWAGALLLVALVSAGIASSFRSSERSLVEAQRRSEAVLDTAVDGIITIDQEGTILSMNRAASRMFGYADGELLGESVSILMDEPDRNRHAEYINAFMRTGEARIIGIGREVQGRRRSGESIPIDLAVSEVRLPDETLFTGIVRDLSEQKIAEAKISAARQRIEEQNQALVQQEKLAAVGQLAAGVAHEISNPLASIDSILQLAQRRESSVSAEQVELLRQQVQRMREVVREITTFARPAPRQLEPVALSEVADQTLELMRFDHRIREVEVVREYSEGCSDIRVPASEQLVQQVILNLVTNALDALKETKSPKLTLRIHCDESECTLEVEDNGPGIPPEAHGRVFDPFYTTKSVGEGTGLGLSISARVVAEIGGRLVHRVNDSGGATFVLSLPRGDRGDRPTGSSPSR